MFDYFRVAALATLALGAAAASSETLPAIVTPLPAAPIVEALPPVSLTTPAPASPVTVSRLDIGELTPDDDAIVAPLSEDRAESLAALVRRHAATTTADAQQECLAGAVYFESKGEPLDGQLAVARVIMNRAESGRFADTICGVVRQRGQFSFVRGGGSFPAIARDGANWRTAVAIARIAMGDMWTAPAKTALYFHARRVSPSWRMTRLAAVGNHIFYR